MCKLFGVTSTEGFNRKTLNATLFAAQAAFSGERHGFGFALRTSRGLYRERYVSPKDFGGVNTAKLLNKHLSPIKDAIDYEADTRGKIGAYGGGLIVHGRTSTNELDIENTHPFVRKDWALAHNGAVDYDGPDRYKRGTCDSEDILNSFVYGKGLPELNKFYSGYAALLALPPKQGFIAYRDDRADLYVSRLISQDGYAFATKAEHMVAILKKADITHTQPMLMKDEHAIVVGATAAEVEVEQHDGPAYRVTSFAESKATGVGFHGSSATSGTYISPTSTSTGTLRNRAVQKQKNMPYWQEDQYRNGAD